MNKDVFADYLLFRIWYYFHHSKEFLKQEKERKKKEKIEHGRFYK